MPTLSEQVEDDEKVVRLSKAFHKLGIYRIDAKSIETEMATIQSIRVANKLDVIKDDLVGQVIANSARDQGYRSRLAEMSFKAYRAKHKLSIAVDKLKRYLQVEYRSEISQTYKTQADRRDFIDSTLEEFVAFIRDMEHLGEQADLLIEDIDKNAWGLKLVLNAVEVHTQREHAL